MTLTIPARDPDAKPRRMRRSTAATPERRHARLEAEAWCDGRRHVTGGGPIIGRLVAMLDAGAIVWLDPSMVRLSE